MEELKAVTLKETQEIENIRIDIADNGGIIVSWSIYTPSKAKSESRWDDHKEVFDNSEDALTRIKELFAAEIARKLNSKK